MRGHRARPRGRITSSNTKADVALRQQIDLGHGPALRGDGVAQQRRRRIDQAAFDARLGQHEAGRAARRRRKPPRSSWRRAGEAPGVRRTNRPGSTSKPQLDGCRARPRRARPAGAARRHRSPRSAPSALRRPGQHHAACIHDDNRPTAFEAQRMRIAIALAPADPAMLHGSRTPRARSRSQVTQQRRGLHVGGKDAARAADEVASMLSPFGPPAQLLRGVMASQRATRSLAAP